MSKLDDDIRKALANGEASYDLDREEGLVGQMAGIFRGKLRWMAIFAVIESIVFLVLIVLALCLALYAVERWIGWPEALSPDRLRHPLRP